MYLLPLQNWFLACESSCFGLESVQHGAAFYSLASLLEYPFDAGVGNCNPAVVAL